MALTIEYATHRFHFFLISFELDVQRHGSLERERHVSPGQNMVFQHNYCTKSYMFKHSSIHFLRATASPAVHLINERLELHSKNWIHFAYESQRRGEAAQAESAAGRRDTFLSQHCLCLPTHSPAPLPISLFATSTCVCVFYFIFSWLGLTPMPAKGWRVCDVAMFFFFISFFSVSAFGFKNKRNPTWRIYSYRQQ